MRARDLAEPYPLFDLDADALEAVRAVGANRLVGLVVTEPDGSPKAIVPGSQVLRFVIPEYVQSDPSLARVISEEAAEQIVRRLEGRSVRELLPDRPHELPVVNGDDTVLEIAAIMARMRSPLVAVVEGGRIVGIVTTSRLLQVALAES
ncbi:MAG: CBS domain-containing protein [Actinomycetota bacterium]|nr:CBS domain-containing protein [Actinomycetota bacterium]